MELYIKKEEDGAGLKLMARKCFGWALALFFEALVM
jgi:hypothetical protein